MNKQELFDKLVASNQEVYIVENELVSPMEIYLVLEENDLPQYFSGIRNMVVGDVVYRLISFSDLGIKNLAEVWKRNAKVVDKNIKKVSPEDVKFFFLWKVMVCTEIPNWLSLHVREVYYSDTCINNIYEFLGDYIVENELSVKIRFIVDLPNVFLERLSQFEVIYYRITLLLKKVRRKLLLKNLTVRGIIHRNFHQKQYMSHIIQDNALDGEWKFIKRNGGSSSSTMIDLTAKNGRFFVKGNELPLYQSIRNEISAQLALASNYNGEEWFVMMNSYDENYRWVKYPFVDSKTLPEYSSVHCLSAEDIHSLGIFLCESVEKLKKINIIHNDYRPGNILVHINKCGTIKGFSLIDFGCASVSNKKPWDDSFWGKYMAESTCGNYRYNEAIVDDAASAQLIYREYGGKADDCIDLKLSSMMGTTFFLMD